MQAFTMMLSSHLVLSMTQAVKALHEQTYTTKMK